MQIHRRITFGKTRLKTQALLALCFSLLFFFSSCSTMDGIKHSSFPKENTQTFMAFHDVNPEFNQKQIKANLYFRYKNTSLLVAEQRLISVRNSETAEFALLKELLKGPKLHGGQLESTFLNSVDVLSALPISGGQLLAVTFSENVLNKDDAQSTSEEKLRRQLALEAVTLSLTDLFPYLGIQFFIKPNDESKPVYRLDNTFFFEHSTEPLLPFVRQEEHLANPQHVVHAILNACQTQNIDTLAQFTANLPLQNQLDEALNKLGQVLSFTVYSGSIFSQGTQATVAAQIQTGQNKNTITFPMQLVDDDGLWKMPYQQLLLLFEAIGEA